MCHDYKKQNIVSNAKGPQPGERPTIEFSPDTIYLRQCKIPQVKDSVLQDSPPHTPAQMLITSLGCYRSLWTISYESEVPTTPSSG